jgi:hypothetical protein
MLLRNVLYHDFINKKGSDYDKIIVADVKDVVFNGTPFTFNGELNCYLEAKTKTIGTEEINSLWLHETFGKKGLDILGHEYISCAGVITGTAEGLSNYYSAYVDELANVTSLKENQLFDQAIHNFIIYTKNIPNLRIVEDEAEEVSTLSYFKKRTKKESKKAILHQYDRNRKLKLKYNKRYNNIAVYRTFAYRKLKHYYYLLRKKSKAVSNK